MRYCMVGKTKEWQEGYATAMVFLYDIFQSRSNALYKRGLRRKDIKMILAVIDAAIYSRNRLAEIGPRNMDLVLCSDGTAKFIERQTKEKKQHDDSPRIDSSSCNEL